MGFSSCEYSQIAFQFLSMLYIFILYLSGLLFLRECSSFIRVVYFAVFLKTNDLVNDDSALSWSHWSPYHCVCGQTITWKSNQGNQIGLVWWGAEECLGGACTFCNCGLANTLKAVLPDTLTQCNHHTYFCAGNSVALK